MANREISKLVSPTQVSRDLSLLHPVVRGCVEAILGQLQQEGIPFELFEGYRSPARQDYLYQQGRTRSGRQVTQAKAWQSYHQYGLAVDLVFKIDGKWDWGYDGQKEFWWDRLQEIAMMYGMEGLQWERPHIQLAGFDLKSLQAGSLPSGGDSSWYDNLIQAGLNTHGVRG